MKRKSNKNKLLEYEKKKLPSSKTTEEIRSNNTHSDDTWINYDTCLVKKFNDFKGSKKILSFDLDNTLIEPKSGNKLPKDQNDWKLIYNSDIMNSKISQYISKDYSMVIFSNQNGIQLGEVSPTEFKNKINSIFTTSLKFPCLFIASTSMDYYRKPCPGMFELFSEKYNDGIQIERECSYYIGDAAGRKKGKFVKKNDFSDSDYKFALNAKINFKTPEQFFLDDKNQSIPKIQSFLHIYDNNNNAHIAFDNKIQEMIILVGSPGSGKSTYAESELVTKGYSRINQDYLKTEKKCIEAAEKEIKEGKSVVIDCTNPKKEKRKVYITLGNKYKIQIRCFIMDVSKDLAFHLNKQREINKERNHYSHAVNVIPIHTFFKYYEEPEKSEGFNDVIHVNFVPGPFKSEKDKEIFYMLI